MDAKDAGPSVGYDCQDRRKYGAKQRHLYNKVDISHINCASESAQ